MLSLLLVDDEMHIVETLAATIPWAELGIGTVHKAYSVSEALDIMNMTPADVVITDISMPGTDGLELVKSIHLYWKRTKCLLLSGYAEFEYAQEAIKHQIAGYLLKPVRDEELIARVQQVVSSIHQENELNDIYERAMKVAREQLPKIRSELLRDLLQGKRIDGPQLQERIGLLELPVHQGAEIGMMLVQFKDGFGESRGFELSLMEFAIGNLAEETFEDLGAVWMCKDIHDYLVIVLIPKPGQAAANPSYKKQVEKLCDQLYANVQQYLRVKISMVMGNWGTFPDQVTKLYDNLLMVFNKRFGHEKDLPVYVMSETESVTIHVLKRLYEPPMLLYVMEAGNWEAAREKLEGIFEELGQDWSESSEHLTEAFYTLFSSFSYIAHKNGHKLAHLISGEYSRGKELSSHITLEHLKEWTWKVFDLFERHALNETRNARVNAVKEAQKFIQGSLADHTSLQSIADHLQMNPAYLSRIYKLETGENLSDYVTRLKVEQAARQLKFTTKKIYEIAMELGYQNANYFIKIFKKHVGLTPQEYRNT
ncbi:two-component system response regulator YesN [Paenibacillus mucilaginosus]